MKCSEAENLFSEAFDERLDSANRLRLSDHMARCESCTAAFDRYRLLFEAVAGLPVLQTLGAAPFPEASRGFGAHSHVVLVPLWRRLTTAAALFLALVALGYSAFELGRQRSDPGIDERAEVKAVEVVLPTLPVAEQLRTFSDDARSLGVVAEISPQYPVQGTVDVFGRMVDSTLAMGKNIVAMDQESLGSFEAKTHDVVGNLVDVLTSLEEEVSRPGAPQERLERVRSLIHRCRYRQLLRDMEPMVRGFSSARRPLPSEFKGQEYRYIQEALMAEKYLRVHEAHEHWLKLTNDRDLQPLVLGLLKVTGKKLGEVHGVFLESLHAGHVEPSHQWIRGARDMLRGKGGKTIILKSFDRNVKLEVVGGARGRQQAVIRFEMEEEPRRIRTPRARILRKMPKSRRSKDL